MSSVSAVDSHRFEIQDNIIILDLCDAAVGFIRALDDIERLDTQKTRLSRPRLRYLFDA